MSERYPLDSEAWLHICHCARLRKGRHIGYRGEDGSSSVDQERAAVAAEMIIGLRLGIAHHIIWPELESAALSPGYQWVAGDLTYRIHGTENKRHYHLIEKVSRATADIYCFCWVDLEGRAVVFRGWIGREHVLRANQRDERGIGLSYWVPISHLFPPDTMPGASPTFMPGTPPSQLGLLS